MRAFIALRPDEESTHRIILLQKDLEKAGDGRWIEKENLHLTMAFLGEIKEEKIPELKKIISDVPFDGDETSVNHIGSFRERNGDLVFLGVEESAELVNAENELSGLLQKNGYPMEARQFLPHISIGRNIHMKMDVRGKLKKKILIRLSEMHLYSSEIINGRRIYEEL